MQRPVTALAHAFLTRPDHLDRFARVLLGHRNDHSQIVAEGPAAKVQEELAEVRHELAADGQDPERITRLTDEIGDLLFATVNLARKAGVAPSGALEQANAKFQRRFEAVEALAAARGIDLETAGLERLDVLWNEVKADGANG